MPKHLFGEGLLRCDLLPNAISLSYAIRQMAMPASIRTSALKSAEVKQTPDQTLLQAAMTLYMPNTLWMTVSMAHIVGGCQPYVQWQLDRNKFGRNKQTHTTKQEEMRGKKNRKRAPSIRECEVRKL